MDREISFRGKRVDNGEWIQGFLFQIWERIYILWGMTNDVPNMIEVDPSTVGQYTGLTDKNGTRIFEGDVLDCEDRVVYVRWHVQYAQWDNEFIRYQGKLCSNGITAVEWKYRSVVIGNIYDGKDGQHDEL